MTFRRLTLIVLLLTCGFLAGVVLTGRLRGADEAVAQPTPAARQATVTPAAAGPLVAPQDFSRIAERTVPAVANISSRQNVRRQNSPFATDPFFNRFFGDGVDPFGGRGVESSLGSGVIVSSDGYILTNNHVVVGEQQRVSLRDINITVALADKREMPARVIGVDPATDLALLKVDTGSLPSVAWGDSSKLKVAEWVLAIGNPYQLSETVTLGIVSAVNRSNVGGLTEFVDFIQTDAAINPGNSGGALVNGRGELVGINTAIFSQSGGYQGIGFAVPSNLARRVVSELQQYGEVRRGSIGWMRIAPLTTQIATELGAPNTRGVLITSMRRDTPAFIAGLRPGDIVVSFNGIEIRDGGELVRLISDARIGSTATVGVIREGGRLDVRVTIGRQ